ncbi:MAG TPA: hypothetical protein VEU97_13290, partial [Ktedonobacteraceae bacterium]|nr:hypothetical protein [Ktedonobacteraceae bacterium]
MLRFPMHAGSFQPRLHHQFIGTFHHARANGPARSLIGWVLHLRRARGQVLQLLAHLRIAAPLAQATQMRQHARWPFMLEPMQDPLQPPLGQPVSGVSHRLRDGTHILGGVGKIQHAHRIRALVVDEALEPLGSIGHR